MAVTALSATTLLESSITRIDQIQEMVPNMSFRSGTPGNSATIQIRGVGTSTTGAAFDPGVGIYIDGGTLGYMDARFDSFPGAIDSITGEVIDRAGQTLNNSPSLQTFIAVQYAVPVNFPVQPWLRGWLTPRLEWAYRSRFQVSGPEIWALEQSG